MKELTQYRIKDSSMEPIYHKGDIVEIQKIDEKSWFVSKLVVVQTREKCFIGIYLFCPRVGYHRLTKGLNTNEYIDISQGRKKFNFYLVNGHKN